MTVDARGRAEQPVKAANLALKLDLELVPGAMMVLWGKFAAPRAQRRLPRATRIAFELAVFALAVAALLAAPALWPAGGFAALALLNAVLLTRFDQWDR